METRKRRGLSPLDMHKFPKLFGFILKYVRTHLFDIWSVGSCTLRLVWSRWQPHQISILDIATKVVQLLLMLMLVLLLPMPLLLLLSNDKVCIFYELNNIKLDHIIPWLARSICACVLCALAWMFCSL